MELTNTMSGVIFLLITTYILTFVVIFKRKVKKERDRNKELERELEGKNYEKELEELKWYKTEDDYLEDVLYEFMEDQGMHNIKKQWENKPYGLESKTTRNMVKDILKEVTKNKRRG